MGHSRQAGSNDSSSPFPFPRKKKNKTAAASVDGGELGASYPRVTSVPVARRTRSQFRNAAVDPGSSSSQGRAQAWAKSVLICLDSEEEDIGMVSITEKSNGISSEESGGFGKAGPAVNVDWRSRQEGVESDDGSDNPESKLEDALKLDVVSKDLQVKDEDASVSAATSDSCHKGSERSDEREDGIQMKLSSEGDGERDCESAEFDEVKPRIETELCNSISGQELKIEEQGQVVILDDPVREGQASSNVVDHASDKIVGNKNILPSLFGKNSLVTLPSHNCVARRTRSKMRSLQSVDYTKYFNDPKDSDDDEKATLSACSYYSSSSQDKVNHKDIGVKQDLGDVSSDNQSHSEKESSDSDFEKAVGEMEEGMLKKGSMIRNDELMQKLWMRNFSRQQEKQASKDEFLFNMFVNTMNKDEDLIPTNIGPSSHCKLFPQSIESPNSIEELPLLFSFGDDNHEPVEKTENQKAIDDLWVEYDFVERSVDIGSYNDEETESEKLRSSCIEGHSCSEDEHFFILDEEIGIFCKYCFFVALKIRNILPSFATRPGGICGRIHSIDKESATALDELCARKKTENPYSTLDPHDGTVWDLIPGIKNELYHHQQEGFEFIWKNVAGGIFLDELKKPSSTDVIGGCVISHAPGTGKSRLTLVFLQSFMKLFPECRPVILAPRGMLLMWEKEFKKWRIDIPFHLLNTDEYNGKEDLAALSLLGTRKGQKWMRLVKLYSWNRGGSILGVSYGLFEKLGQSFKQQTGQNHFSKLLIERPDLFIFDEGHTPRNERSNIWKVLGKIKAERRIILSGTPFQNNFTELYNTLCLVRPRFADKVTSKKSVQKYIEEYGKISSEKDEGRGNWASLTNYINDENLEELRSIIKPFVHVHNGTILKQLPGSRDCLVLLKPLSQQSEIIKIVETIRANTSFGLEYKTSLVAIHPSLLVTCELSEKEKYEIRKHSLDKSRLDPSFGIKTRFVMEIVRLSGPLNEKVLIFSQYIEPLVLVKDQLLLAFGWTEGKEVLQMDGKLRLKQRQASIDHFNDPTSDVQVLLASTKACCEGITLTGASRVVLLDVVWNPSVEEQAISRAYRLGQTKVVYTYHLIAHGTREVDKYNRQIEKHQISKLVFSAKKHDDVVDKSFHVSDDKILGEMLCNRKLEDILEEVRYEPRESCLILRR